MTETYPVLCPNCQAAPAENGQGVDSNTATRFWCTECWWRSKPWWWRAWMNAVNGFTYEYPRRPGGGWGGP
jgi:hypothetical protein